MRRLNLLLFFLGFLGTAVIVSCNGEDPVEVPDVETKFQLSATEILVGESISFMNQSTGEPITFDWSFPGGSPATSSDENPQVTYNTAGTYSVTLEAANKKKSDIETKESVITVYEEIASILESSDTVVVRGQEVEFVSNSLGNIDSYSWIFEGGTPQTSTDESPVVEYLDLGAFDVSLDVNGFGEGASLLVEDHITVLDSVKADFTSNSGSFLMEEDESIQFEQTSTGNPVSYLWSFEGGTPATSTDENPSVQYTAQGTYDVKLIAYHEAHADTLEMTDVVTVLEKLEATFESDFTSIPDGQSVNFTDASTGNPTSWLWEFEGGTPSVSTDQNPSVTYDEIGNYDVKLVVNNGYATKEIIMQDYIQVSGLVGHFKFDSDLTDETDFGDWSYTNLATNNTPVFGADRSGDPSPAASLDYDGLAVVISNADRLLYNEVTISLWLQTTRVGGFYAILDKYSSAADYGYILTMNNGKIHFRGRDASGNFRDCGPSITSVNDGNWHHVVGVMTKNSTWQVWIDGNLEAELVGNFEIPRTLNSAQTTFGSSATSAIPISGDFDDLKLFNRALTQAEIQALANE
jgi:PKD repeat protein